MYSVCTHTKCEYSVIFLRRRKWKPQEVNWLVQGPMAMGWPPRCLSSLGYSVLRWRLCFSNGRRSRGRRRTLCRQLPLPTFFGHSAWGTCSRACWWDVGAFLSWLQVGRSWAVFTHDRFGFRGGCRSSPGKSFCPDSLLSLYPQLLPAQVWGRSQVREGPRTSRENGLDCRHWKLLRPWNAVDGSRCRCSRPVSSVFPTARDIPLAECPGFPRVSATSPHTPPSSQDWVLWCVKRWVLWVGPSHLPSSLVCEKKS